MRGNTESFRQWFGKTIQGVVTPGKRAANLLLALVVLLPGCALFPGSATATPPATPHFAPVTAALEIEPEALPAARQGETYTAEIHISKNVTPVGDMAIKTGQLPAGLQFEFLKGKDAARISGVPAETGTFTITLSIWCFGTMVPGQTLQKEYQIVVGE